MTIPCRLNVGSTRFAVLSLDHHVTYLFLEMKRVFSTKRTGIFVNFRRNSVCMSTSSLSTMNRTQKPYVRLKQLKHYRSFHNSSLLGQACLFRCLTLKPDFIKHLKLCKNHSVRFCTFVDHKLPKEFRSHPPWRLLFFGTDDFAVATLKALNENRMEPHLRVVDTVDVVSNKGKTAVRKYANEAGLAVHDWPIPTWQDQYDAGILVSFGHLIPERIIHMFPYGILNVHPSLLPRWRGASPIIHTILSGDVVTGISLMEIRPKHFDIGPLLMQKEIPVPKMCTSKQLSEILAPLGAGMVIQALFDLPRLERMEIEQEYRGITYANKLKPEMAFIDWENQTPEELDRLFRGFNEILPLRSQWKNSHVKLLEMCQQEQLEGSEVEIAVIKHFHVSSSSLPAGTPFFYKAKNLLLIKCKNGWVGFQNIVYKKRLDPLAFYNGYLSKKENRGMKFKSISSDERSNHSQKLKQFC